MSESRPEPAPEGAVRSLLGSLKSSLVVVGSALIALAALRNSLTQHVRQLWGDSGELWQALWDRVYDLFGGNQYSMFVYGSLALSVLMYWAVGAVYILLDITLKPQQLRRYKIQPGTNEPVDPRRLLQAAFWVVFNQVAVGWVMGEGCYYLLCLRGFDTGRQLPTFQWVLFELTVFILIDELGFYYSHRLLHSRLLYRRVHKWHHEWTSPIAIAAIYAHPLEYMLSNIGPLLLGVLVMGSHMATTWLWFCLAIFNTINSHSGYHLPFFPSPEAHDFHHQTFTQCFGMLGVLDRLHGTDAKFRASPAYQRHIMLLSLVPLRQAYPDPEKRICSDSSVSQ